MARVLSTETDKSFFTFQPKPGEEQVLSLFRIVDRLELPDKSTVRFLGVKISYTAGASTYFILLCRTNWRYSHAQSSLSLD